MGEDPCPEGDLHHGGAAREQQAAAAVLSLSASRRMTATTNALRRPCCDVQRARQKVLIQAVFVPSLETRDDH